MSVLPECMEQMIEKNIESWISICTKMLAKTYCIYSNFPVSCVLIGENNEIFTGCNVENSSYGLSICAERTAIVKAVSEGIRKFKACVVLTECERFVYPCGACRQFLSEFGMSLIVISALKNGQYECRSLADLLPNSFSSSDLEETAITLAQPKTATTTTTTNTAPVTETTG